MNEILDCVEESGAASIHIRIGQIPRMRVNGRMTKLRMVPVRGEDFRDLVSWILTKEQEARFERRGELYFTHRTADGAYHGNLFKMAGGQGLVFRPIPRSLPKPDTLGVPVDVHGLLSMPRGLILFSGSSGSGMKRTLGSMVLQASREHDPHIVTVEDPITFYEEFHWAQQIEVGRNIDSTPEGVALASRIGPDLLMVGEVRDRETMTGILRASASGILVLAGIRGSSITHAIARMESCFSPEDRRRFRSSLADEALAIVGHRRVPGDSRTMLETLINGAESSAAIRQGKYAILRGMISSERPREAARQESKEIAAAGQLVPASPAPPSEQRIWRASR
ncbi:MAG: ATPase, T2SS/T4P/T4SS family [Planctomycetota bacterium]